ncbi:hypothetical protein Tco_0936632 [Tanacetum coccineum]|uniref:Uncharacterized protein n=1 Tax=Tanacetum coccineum TaxID=301880 RepID=A0ABQ5DEL2_9ASTR
MAFLEDNRDTVISGQASQEIPTLAVFQTDDLDAFDSNCNEAPSASDYSKQLVFDNDTNIEITSKSNIISYEQYLKETKNAVIQNTSSFAQQDALMPVIKEMSNQIAKCNEVDKHDALSIIDTKETLELAKESRLKMHAKQNDPIAKDKKVNIIPIDYAALNKLSEHFVKHFVPQK